MDNRPRSREKNVTGQSSGVNRRGSGLGTGPVGGGRTSGSSNRGGNSSGSGNNGRNSQGGQRGSCLGVLVVLIIIVVLIASGGMKVISWLFSDSSDDDYQYEQYSQSTDVTEDSDSWMPSISTGNTGSHFAKEEDTADTSTSPDARAKYTEILGDGKDTVTVMVYLCGTDLESKNANASKDMQEMAKATFGDNVNLLVYTGGASKWKIDAISNKTHQIYQIADGNLYRLEDDMGNGSMTDPANLTEFINYCTENYPANRNELILWDHGGGSLTGYGYDETKPASGSMTLTKISQALKDADTKFDFIGFDACLMATAENALMLEAYADYLIASEETEPGIGWYYTPWLDALGKDTSISSVSLGKTIVDSFISECNRKCQGQKTTLSVIDLAEFKAEVPKMLKEFSNDTAELLKEDQYGHISTARSNTREFAVSSKIDQVDLCDLAKKIDAASSKDLIAAVESAVKYNRTGGNMSNAYGVSIYFPYKMTSTSYVKQASQLNETLGLSEYSRCIQEFATLQQSGQAVAYGTGNAGSAYESVSGNFGYSGDTSVDLAIQFIDILLGGSSVDIGGRSIESKSMAEYVTSHEFDPSNLEWTSDGKIKMPESQWKLINDVALNIFFDDGEGYIDMGLDNSFDFDSNGALIPDTDGTWLAINGQPVAYYYESTIEDGDDYSITGIVPALLNGTRVNLVLVFDQDNPHGYIAGAGFVYKNGETDTVAKIDIELEEGDVLEFLCDFYDYDGRFRDSYYLGEPMTVTSDMEISDVYLEDGEVLISYKFTDIYNNEYWTPVW